MRSLSVLLLSLAASVLGADNALLSRQSSSSTLRGDAICRASMCVSATVLDDSIQYVLQSTGAYYVGWMAIGFGTSMSNSNMVIMWPNSDGSVTLSQRTASGHNMPTPQNNPPKPATLLSSLSIANSSLPTLAFSIPINQTSGTQNLIYGFSKHRPSSAPDSHLDQHSQYGRLNLNLGNTISQAESVTPYQSSAGAALTGPMTTTQKVIAAHGLMCGLAFLIFIPFGVVFARWMRTYTPSWYQGHWIIQWGISGPIIILGIILGFVGVGKNGDGHFNDPHKALGLVILLLYLAQCSLGAFVHYIKPARSWTYRGRRWQNYLHGILGIITVIIGYFQMHIGYANEWPDNSGRKHFPNVVNIVCHLFAALAIFMYILGLYLFLRKQYRQEAEQRAKLDGTSTPPEGYLMAPQVVSEYRD